LLHNYLRVTWPDALRDAGIFPVALVAARECEVRCQAELWVGPLGVEEPSLVATIFEEAARQLRLRA
jgi:hypothetical protein